MRVTEQYVFFFTEKDFFSNWFIARFSDNKAWKWNPEVESSISFGCVEQYMMWRKASLFKAYDVALAILSGSRQRKNEKPQAYYKRMGREVPNYDEEVWQLNREAIVKRGMYLKYTQNPELKEVLLQYRGKQFVEASPYDAIYGIKMGMWDVGVENPDNWKGENLLGEWHNHLLHFLDYPA